MANFKKLIFIVIAVVSVTSTAIANDIFASKYINVDVTDKNSEIARRKAMNQGQYSAFHKVIDRIVPAKDKEFLPEFSAKEISYLLKEVSVIKESSSPVRYVATLNVSFDEEKIKKALTEMGISFVLSASKPYLMVPIFKENNKVSSDENQWQKIWSLNPPQTVLIPLKKISTDDLEDVSERLSTSKIKSLAKKYNTDGVVVAEVNQSAFEVKLVVRKYTTNGSLSEIYEQVFPIEDQNINDVYRKIANSVAKTNENSWRDQMAVNVAEPVLMVVVVPLQDLAHLNNVTSRIAKIPLIARYELKAVKQDRAQIDIWHSSDINALEKGFLGQKMKLLPIGDAIFGIEDLTVKSKVKPEIIAPQSQSVQPETITIEE